MTMEDIKKQIKEELSKAIDELNERAEILSKTIDSLEPESVSIRQYCVLYGRFSESIRTILRVIEAKWEIYKLLDKIPD